MATFRQHPSSYRDPSGFVFYKDDVLYRQVNVFYKDEFRALLNSGLYSHLIKQEQLIDSAIIEENFTGSPYWFCTLKPEPLSFVSYPYEWCFAMLKDAAMLTLDILEEALQKGMILKDATPYNVQLHNGKMIFIDTLSFERYDPTKPWIAYKQFCESFLLPLALMHYSQVPLQTLFFAYPEGIPLTVGKKLLPWKSKWNMNTYLHLHLNAAVINKKSDNKTADQPPFSAKKLANIIRSLKEAVSSYKFENTGIWSGYYAEATQREDYVTQKQHIIAQWLTNLPPIGSAIDVGANEGLFSELLASRGIPTIAADFDHYSISRLYEKTKQEGLLITPLVIDFANPSPAMGVNNTERSSFLDRVNTDLVLALAVVHHLAIGKNIPFHSIAELFRKLGGILIVEFIPKEDEKIQYMLQQKKDVYVDYNEEGFRQAFALHYRIADDLLIGQSGRKLFLMIAHEA